MVSVSDLVFLVLLFDSYTPPSGAAAARRRDTGSWKCVSGRPQRAPPEPRRRPGRRRSPPPPPTEPRLLHNKERRARVRLGVQVVKGVFVSLLSLVLSHTGLLISLSRGFLVLIWTWTQYLVLTSRSDRTTLSCCVLLMLLACRGRQRTAGFTQNALQRRAGQCPGVIGGGGGTGKRCLTQEVKIEASNTGKIKRVSRPWRTTRPHTKSRHTK